MTAGRPCNTCNSLFSRRAVQDRNVEDVGKWASDHRQDPANQIVIGGCYTAASPLLDAVRGRIEVLASRIRASKEATRLQRAERAKRRRERAREKKKAAQTRAVARRLEAEARAELAAPRRVP